MGYKSQEIGVEKNQIINVLMDQDAMVVDLKNTGGTASNNKQSTSQNSPATSATKVTFIASEDLPHYAGGTEAIVTFLEKNLKYPEDAKKAGIEGVVYVNFVVDAQGQVTLPKIMRSASPSLNAEALRLVGLMKDWKPAMQNGEPMSSAVTMPIEFKIK